MSRTMSIMRVHIRTCVCNVPTYLPLLCSLQCLWAVVIFLFSLFLTSSGSKIDQNVWCIFGIASVTLAMRCLVRTWNYLYVRTIEYFCHTALFSLQVVTIFCSFCPCAFYCLTPFVPNNLRLSTFDVSGAVYVCMWLIHIICFCLPFLFVFFILPFYASYLLFYFFFYLLPSRILDPLRFQPEVVGGDQTWV